MKDYKAEFEKCSEDELLMKLMENAKLKKDLAKAGDVIDSLNLTIQLLCGDLPMDCPFCGAPSRPALHENGHYNCACTRCHASTVACPDAVRAVQLWNRRV